jgi:hypothetical protein
MDIQSNTKGSKTCEFAGNFQKLAFCPTDLFHKLEIFSIVCLFCNEHAALCKNLIRCVYLFIASKNKIALL